MKRRRYTEDERLQHAATRLLARAAKKAKAFEVKKAIRKCKEGRPVDLDALKSLDLQSVVATALFRAGLATASHEVSDAARRVLASKPMRDACADVRARRPIEPALVVLDEPLAKKNRPGQRQRRAARDARDARAEPLVKKNRPGQRQRRAQHAAATEQPAKPEPKPQHASWAAAQARKAMEANTTFQGTKLTFGDE